MARSDATPEKIFKYLLDNAAIEKTTAQNQTYMRCRKKMKLAYDIKN